MPFINNQIRINLKPPRKGSFSEIYSTGLLMKTLDPDGNACHDGVLCKDFIQDIYWAMNNDAESVQIYGFSWSKKDPHPSMDKIRIAISNKKVTAGGLNDEIVKSIAEFLNKIEEDLAKNSNYSIDPTIVMPIENAPGEYFIQGSAKWISHPALLSAYTLLIRVGQYHTLGKPYQDTIDMLYKHSGANSRFPQMYSDANYLKTCKQGIDAIIATGGNVFPETVSKNWNSGKACSVGKVHDNSGVCAFSKPNYAFRTRRPSVLKAKYNILYSKKSGFAKPEPKGVK